METKFSITVRRRVSEWVHVLFLTEVFMCDDDDEDLSSDNNNNNRF